MTVSVSPSLAWRGSGVLGCHGYGQHMHTHTHSHIRCWLFSPGVVCVLGWAGPCFLSGIHVCDVCDGVYSALNISPSGKYIPGESPPPPLSSLPHLVLSHSPLLSPLSPSLPLCMFFSSLLLSPLSSHLSLPLSSLPPLFLSHPPLSSLPLLLTLQYNSLRGF